MSACREALGADCCTSSDHRATLDLIAVIDKGLLAEYGTHEQRYLRAASIPAYGMTASAVLRPSPAQHEGGNPGIVTGHVMYKNTVRSGGTVNSRFNYLY